VPTPGLLGCRPFVHTALSLAKMQIAEQSFKALGPPPAQCYPWYKAVEAVSEDWGMLGNDAVGDCVIADNGHKVMLWSANRPGGKMIMPTTAEILAYYSALTGYDPSDPNTDQGADPTANADYLVANGITIGGVHHKVDAWVPVDPTNADGSKWATHLFGCQTWCVSLPQSAMDQFGAGQPWTVLADDGGLLGGHDILNCYYASSAGKDWWYPITWGKRQRADDPWRAKYLTMAIAYLSKDMFNQQAADAAGFQYQALVTALNAVGTLP
jgi:hypothetical protein